MFPLICGVTQLRRLLVDYYELPLINNISRLARLTSLELGSCERYTGEGDRADALWEGIVQLRELQLFHIDDLGASTIPEGISNLQQLR